MIEQLQFLHPKLQQFKKLIFNKFAAGFAYETVNRVFLIGLMIYLGAVTLFCMPLVGHYKFLYLIMAVQGLTVGMVDPGTNLRFEYKLKIMYSSECL